MRQIPDEVEEPSPVAGAQTVCPDPARLQGWVQVSPRGSDVDLVHDRIVGRVDLDELCRSEDIYPYGPLRGRDPPLGSGPTTK